MPLRTTTELARAMTAQMASPYTAVLGESWARVGVVVTVGRYMLGEGCALLWCSARKKKWRVGAMRERMGRMDALGTTSRIREVIDPLGDELKAACNIVNVKGANGGGLSKVEENKQTGLALYTPAGGCASLILLNARSTPSIATRQHVRVKSWLLLVLALVAVQVVHSRVGETMKKALELKKIISRVSRASIRAVKSSN